MIRACDDCIHAGICKLEDMYNHILNVTKQDLEDFDEIKDIFEVQLVCSKKMSKLSSTSSISFTPGYRADCTQISTYPED